MVVRDRVTLCFNFRTDTKDVRDALPISFVDCLQNARLNRSTAWSVRLGGGPDIC